jgi:hypothetical protein
MLPCVAWEAGELSANTVGAKASAEAMVAAAMIRVIVMVFVSSPVCDPMKPRHASTENPMHGSRQVDLHARTDHFIRASAAR